MSEKKTHITKKFFGCIRCLIAVTMLIQTSVLSAQKISVTARLDSAHLLMGRTTHLHLDVDKPIDLPGHFPIFDDSDGRGYATVNGDTIELSKQFSTDTVNLGDGRCRITYHVPVQVFDSGYYKLPQFQYVAGPDTAASNSVDLKVVPLDIDKDAEIAGLTDVEDPEKGPWTDLIPEFFYNYWWALLAGVIALTALYVIIRKYLRKKPKAKKKAPALPPYEEAMKALNALKAKNLWQQNQGEEYFVELTGILRHYLSRRFGVAAPEMTTAQFLDEASRNKRLVDYNAELRRLLELADFVKFAKGQSLPDENEEAFAIVRKFVEDTKPTQEEQQELKLAESTETQRPTLTGTKINTKKSTSVEKSPVRKTRDSEKSKNKNSKSRIPHVDENANKGKEGAK